MASPTSAGLVTDDHKLQRVALSCRLAPRSAAAWLAVESLPLEGALRVAEREGHVLGAAVLSGRLGRLDQALKLFSKSILTSIEEYMESGKPIDLKESTKSLKGLQKMNFVMKSKQKEEPEIYPPEFHLSTCLFCYETTKDHLSKVESPIEKKLMTQRFLDDLLRIKIELDKLAEKSGSSSKWDLTRTLKFMELLKFFTEKVLVDLLTRGSIWFGMSWIVDLAKRAAGDSPSIGTEELLFLLTEFKMYTRCSFHIKSKCYLSRNNKL